MYNKLLKQYKQQKFTCTHPRGKAGEGKDQAHRKTEIYETQHVQQNSSSNITLHKLTSTTSIGARKGERKFKYAVNRDFRGTASTANSSSSIKLHKFTCTKARGREGRGKGKARRKTEIYGAQHKQQTSQTI